MVKDYLKSLKSKIDLLKSFDREILDKKAKIKNTDSNDPRKLLKEYQDNLKLNSEIEQLKEMLSVCENKRERLIVLIASSTGLRCNELTNIRVQDFVNKNGTICLYVLGKARQGLRTDYVVIPNEIYQEIQDYIKENDIKEYLFVSTSNNNKGNLMSTRAIRNIVNKIYDKIGLDSNLYVFHSLRHGFCNISLTNNIDIVEVSKAMRHKSIQTTMNYVRDIEAKDNRCFATVGSLVLN